MMNYLEFFDNKIKKYQNPSGPLPKDPEAFDRVQKLYEQDQPLSGTDPIMEMWVTGEILRGPLEIFSKGFSKAISLIKKQKGGLPKGWLDGQKIKPKTTSSTQETATFTPNVDPEKALSLTQERVRNGGAERMKAEITKGTPGQIAKWENSMPTPIEGQLSTTFYDDVATISSEAPIEVTAKEFSNATGVIKRPEGLGVGLPQRAYVSFTDAPATPGTVMKAHEYTHYVHTPLEKAPGINWEYIEKEYGKEGIKYFQNLNSTEINARFNQLKNYFGLKEGQQITPEMWKYAKEHYVTDTHLDNNMTDFFNMVDPKKLDEFLKWGNANAPIFTMPIISVEAKQKLQSVKTNKTGGRLNTLPTECLIGVTKINMIPYFNH